MSRVPCWFLSLLFHGAILAVGVGVGVRTPVPYEPPVVTVTLAPPSGPLLAEFQDQPVEPEVESPRELPPAEDEVVPPLLEFVIVPIPVVETPAVEAPVPAVVKPASLPPPLPAVAPPAAPSTGASGVETEIPATEVNNPAPQYPLAARRRGLEAEVVVEIAIAPDGSCGGARVVENSGLAAFGDAALAAVRKWTFRPATLGGRPVGSSQRIRFVFKLKA